MPNANVLEAKKAIVAEMTEKLQNAASGVLVDYKGITVAEDTALRTELRKNDVEYAVVKNTLTRFAAEGAGLGELSECLNGTTSLAISHSDPIAPMRVINKFAKQFNEMCIRDSPDIGPDRDGEDPFYDAQNRPASGERPPAPRGRT